MLETLSCTAQSWYVTPLQPCPLTAFQLSLYVTSIPLSPV
jgi:hypothetical protein